MIARTSTTQHLTRWLNQTAQQQPSQIHIGTKQCISAVGIGVGMGSAYIMYVLNAQFGEEVSDYFNIDDPLQVKVIKNIFGITGLICMASLGGINIKDTFCELIDYLLLPDLRPKEIFKKKSYLEYTVRGLAIIAAPISSIPQSTLTWNNITNEGSQIFFSACAVTAPTFFNGRGGQKFIDRLKKTDKTALMLVDYFKQCKTFIKEMPAPEQLSLINRFITSRDNLTENFFDILFSAHPFQPDTRAHSQSEKILSVIGAVIGLLSAIIFYQLTLEGAANPLNANIAEQHVLAIFSYLLTAALSAIATQLFFENFCHLFLMKNTMSFSKKEISLLIFSILVSPFAALPLGSLQIQNGINGSWIQKSLILPTFFSPMCVRGKALYDALNRLTLGCKKLGNNQSRSKLNIVLNTLDFLQKITHELNQEALMELIEKLNNAANQQQNRLRV